MKKVYYAKTTLWGIIKRIITPRLKSPGMPLSSSDGDPFLISESDEVEYVEHGTTGDALKALVPYIKYAWNSGQLKMTTKFMTVGLIGLIINVIIVQLLVTDGVDKRVAGIIGTIVTIFTNFLINDHWTFSEHRTKRPWLHRLAGYYVASLGTMIVQIIIYEAMVMTVFGPITAVIVSVALSYVLRLIYIRDRVYKASTTT